MFIEIRNGRRTRTADTQVSWPCCSATELHRPELYRGPKALDVCYYSVHLPRVDTTQPAPRHCRHKHGELFLIADTAYRAAHHRISIIHQA